MSNCKSCCLNCKERCLNCHSRCSKYKEYKEYLDFIKQRKKEAALKYSLFISRRSY